MLWFSMQSLLMLLLAFVVGLLVGWLAWGRQWQPLQDAADLDDRAGSRHRAHDGDGGLSAETFAGAAVAAADEPSRLDALLASLTQPDEPRSTPVVGVAPRSASESVATATAEAVPVDAPPDEYVAASSTTRQGAAEAVSRIAAAAQRVADRPEARPAEPSTGSFRTSFEPATDPFGLALAPAQTTEGADTGEVTLAAFGEHLALSTPGKPRSESVFHEDDDLVTVLNQSNHAPVTLDPGSAMIDDLTRIEGVNSAMAAALASEGLRTYEDVAKATEDRLRRALRIARIRSAPGIGFWAPRAAKLVQQQASASASSAREASSPGPETPSAEPTQAGPTHDEPTHDEPAQPVDDETLDPAAVGSVVGEDLREEPEQDLTTTGEEPSDQAPSDHAPSDLAPSDQTSSDETTWDETSFDALLSEPLTAADYAAGPAVDEASLEESATEESAAEESAAEAATPEGVVSEAVPEEASPEDAVVAEPAAAEDAVVAKPAAAEVVSLPSVRTDGPTTARHAEPVTPARGSAWLGAGDDLEQIGGVGRRISEVLQAAGISSFVQLAAARDHELRTILTDAGVRQPASLVTWSVQAALLLQGDVEGAATLADGLMTGRETG